MDIRNTRQLKEFSAGRLANARDGQKIILYFSLITIAATALANVASYVLSRQIAKTGGLGSMGVRSALTTAQTLLPLVQAGFLMCLTLGYLATMLRIARGQYASPNGMRLGFDRFWVLLRCTLLKGLIFGGAAAASLYVAMMIYMMTPLSNAAVDILMPLVKNAGASGIVLDDATYAGFEGAITARENAGESQRTEIRSMHEMAIDIEKGGPHRPCLAADGAPVHRAAAGGLRPRRSRRRRAENLSAR